MRTILFIIVILSTGVIFASEDSLSVGNTDTTDNYVIIKEGKASVIDSVVRTEEEIVIFIDGIKIPAIQSRETVKPFPLPLPKFPAPAIKDSNSKSDTLVSVLPGVKAVKKASVNGGIPFLYYIIGLLVLGLIGAILYTKKKEDENGDNGTSEAVASGSTTNPVVPATTTPEPENRFVPAIDADYAPAYRTGNTSISRGEVPELVERAYSNTPNFVSQHGNVSNVRDVKFGKLNGRFRMEHSDGNVSVQQFNNEPGFKATATLEGGLNVFIYSRFGCMNNVRALRLAEVSEEPTFTETTEETVGSATVTTQFQPEPVPSEITEIPVLVPVVETPAVPVPEVPVPVAEVVTAPPAVPAEPAPIATTDDDPVVTAEINGVKITARLSALKQLIK